jgi:putative ABC transport system ATP-binding protein
MFSLKGVYHAYGNRAVLRVAEWSVAQGEHWLVLGASGSGKTTLLHVLAGILSPTEGAVSIAGQALGELSAHQLDQFRGRAIGIVFQRLHLISSLSVLGNLRLAQYFAHGRDNPTAAQLLLESLGLGDKLHDTPRTLSFGQSQRAAVARAVVNQPRLILADEPTSNLDDGNAAATVDLLVAQAQACGATLLIATHDSRIRTRFTHVVSMDRLS